MINISLKKKLKNLKVVIAVHEFDLKGGAAQDLEKFFLNNDNASLLFISHPLLNKDLNLKEKNQMRSHYRYLKDGKVIKTYRASYFGLPASLIYFKDFIYTLFWCKSKNERYDLFVGYDPLNAIAGIVLKKFGLVKRVVYYSIDYFPQRFENNIMNRIYHTIDKFCVRFCDETWNVGSLMEKARAKNNNMDKKIYAKQYYVPIGIWFSKIKRKPLDKMFRKKLIYAGHLAPHMGVDLIINAMPQIIKAIPDVQLEIIGMGESEDKIKDLAKSLGVFGSIRFYGWIGDRDIFQKRLCDGLIGLAPFKIDKTDDRVKNADPGKLKDYMVCGLPVITTKAVSTYEDIEKAGAGIIIDYDADQLASAVLKLLKNDRLLAQYRANAISYVEQFDWNVLFGKNLERLLNKEQ